jgi:hypothetical protein
MSCQERRACQSQVGETKRTIGAVVFAIFNDEAGVDDVKECFSVEWKGKALRDSSLVSGLADSGGFKALVDTWFVGVFSERM